MSAVCSSPAETGVRVADYALARIGGAPASSLEPLILSRTAAELRHAFLCEAAAAELVPAVEAALFRLVAGIAHERPLCRRVLRLKRSVHNGGGDTATEDCAVAAELLRDPTEREALLDWQRLITRRAQHMACARSCFEEELQGACAVSRTLLEDGEIQKGLAVASPGLLEALFRDGSQSSPKQWKPSSRLARSAVSYFARIALKTSPFSTFTHIDLWDFHKGSACESQESRRGSTALRLARMLPMTWIQSIARDPELAPALAFELNPTLRHSRHILQGRFQLHGSFAWREEQISALRDADCDPRLLERLQSLGTTFAYSELLSAIGAGAVQVGNESVHRLLEAQVIRPVASFARQEAAPVKKLAHTLTGTGSPRGSRLAMMMLEIAEAVDACEKAASASRIQILKRIREKSLEVFAELGTPAPEWVNTHSLVYESSRWSGRPASLPVAVQQELEQVMRPARQRMVRAKLAEFVYRYFLERFGPEGETSDITGFLADFLGREDFRELVARSLTEDRRMLARRSSQDSAGRKGSAAPAATIFFQIAAESAAALQRGDFKLVVNQVSSGHGGMLGRFVDLLEEPPFALRTRLREWLTALKPDSVILELPVVNDWSNLHPVVGACDQLLRWPGEIATSDSASTERQMDGLLLRADTQNGELYFVDREGRKVTPVYLGVAPTERIQGALGIFLLLLDPWVSDHLIGRHQRRFATTSGPAEEIEFFPRQEEGRLVLRRAQWRVPITRLARQGKNESEFEFLARMQRWQQENQIPEEVFAEVETLGSIFSGAQKPVWVHFHSPHTLSVLANAIGSDTVAVRFTEMLPARWQHWYSSGEDSGDRRVTEFVALASCPDAESEARPERKPVSCQVRPSDRDWLFFKIYPGSVQLLDEAVRSIVIPVIEGFTHDEIERWFFVRYIDERGPHIRFRLRPRACASGLRSSIVDLIEERLPILRAERIRRPLAPSRMPLSTGNWRGLVEGMYEPEYVKYGGPPVIDVVEQAFEQSSAIALRALPDEMDALTGAAFMKASVASCGTDPAEFWAHYLWHWTGQYEAGAAEARGFLLNTARDRLALFTRQLSAAALRPAASRLVNEFGVLMAATMDRVRRLSNPEHAEAVRFDLIHMHNNRWVSCRPRRPTSRHS